jgi:protein TilB
VPFIEQLYLTGNPCTDWELYRKVVIAMVPQLKQLDGKDITHSERLDALQELSGLLAHLKVAVQQGLYQRPTTYTIDARNEMAKENQRIQEEKDSEKKKQEEKELGIN